MTTTITVSGTASTAASPPPATRPGDDLIIGEDGLARPRWAARDPLLRDYYDTEWGVVVTDERTLFEILALEVFQTGLSWQTVLRRRAAFRRAFDDFDPEVVAAYGEGDVARLLADDSIIRNTRKVEAVIANAKAAVALRADGGLPELVWSAMPVATPVPTTQAEVPTATDASAALASDLRARGFTLVGPVTMHALMAAAGVIDCHLVGSHRRGCSGLWTKAGKRRRRPVLAD
ncbi:MAG TPA: DNA-3-methyladenine glycosylase I [Propionibacteriaceae bacterium]|mgnify:CR=1 FL=1|nr:DNA-3-methyladenine glycosylase I [Propionibacteriaceae bacterium]